ncbi:hypothetical protein [Texcoconibacillus texcoconensis]|uniref:Uncharacterized protein n=1 Tax=Texcoconibacillus texcoconensis TaxID=1095777 RepID=A0A840QRZ0_9BACI|nr:hypothetical protein [Texcoconibacillus texcoconensis]MBB5174262.1 hypothetical protein [Texcoconibacillus texcoconensis]
MRNTRNEQPYDEEIEAIHVREALKGLALGLTMMVTTFLVLHFIFGFQMFG